MRLLFLGDMVGKTGRTAVWQRLPGLISDLKLDFVIVNGENAAGGFGITEDIFLETINAGADVVTTGNHVWDQKEAVSFCERHDQFLRPANYPAGTPGKGSGIFYARNGARILVANIMGRVFMHPELDDPFKSAEAILDACPLKEQADAVVFDFHAEATSEKQCFGHFVDGRASFVVGTHTHVPTADHQILNGGTAYMSDAGMCGDYDSSLGMEKEEPLNRFISKMPKGRFEAAHGPATICGVGVEISDRTGLAEKIAPLRLGARLAETLPEFWR
ncbi:MULTISPECIES: TIGR00282 family metallophosphoesterase [Alphaproteobacteria]|uniref:Metallophosphoesterase n=2 Tax=Alphaproteobacteria TaxID=28211 RepID=A0A512HPK7_9HYPH|nr:MULTISPECIES: TIGR00282 family metallophosphoesterase [Alphaproteobacteria]GEO87392.1 metallophosphoesterase [Ciceribacter naphthalenivorans]GLR23764.1 metallophosphoesterase [Ciceribacter naphthalenivorans]GLT06620.1 metallophosphoesterase [Sphingomonas psychrolutea]